MAKVRCILGMAKVRCRQDMLGMAKVRCRQDIHASDG